MTTVSPAGTLESWLSSLPSEDGFAHISRPRAFAHDESQYDKQYGNQPADLAIGHGVMNLLREWGAPMEGAALEIGCGTGLATAGVIAEMPYSVFIATDPSPAFLRITRNKLTAQGLPMNRVKLAVMMGEEIHRLPESSLSLILLRSTLHHILDIPAFLRDSARVLKRGGVITCEEPCLEGYLLMGTVAQFFPMASAQAGSPLNEEQLAKVDLFIRTMQFYSRKDVDKSQAEDKHLFRVDELMEYARDCGMTVKFQPNAGYRYFSVPPHERGLTEGFRAGVRRAVKQNYRALLGQKDTGWFRRFAAKYVKESMGWDAAFAEQFDRVMGPYLDYVDESSKGGRVPYLNGTFLFRKS